MKPQLHLHLFCACCQILKANNKQKETGNAKVELLLNMNKELEVVIMEKNIEIVYAAS